MEMAETAREDVFRMTPKERITAAFDFKQQDDEIPAWELEFHLFREMFGKEPIMAFEFDKLSEAEKERAICYDAELLIEVAETLGHSAIRCIPGYWEQGPNDPAYLWIRDEKYRMMLVRELSKRGGDQYLIIGDCPGLLGIPDGNHIWEFVDEMYENADELKERANKMIRGGIEYGKRMVDAGAECLINCCDFSFNSGPFMSPAQFDEFVTPYLNLWVETFKSQGIYTIQHSDGNLMPIMDRILDSGVHAIQCVDPLAGMDIVALKKELQGKLCLIGNIDCSILQLGTPHEVDSAVKNVVENCKYDGGFVLSGCNVIFRGIPAENYQAMVDAKNKYGKFTQ